MSTVRTTDPDFRVCRISFNTLLEIQREAEERGWATRWTSVEALRGQVKERDAFLHPLMREERGGVVRAYRCALLFSAAGTGGSGGVATVDVAPEKFESLDRLDRDTAVRRAFSRIFSLAMGGTSMVSKE
ncbi:hypothetical protein [Streptomyces sp. CNQ085]|uniref:hypothetical protein n=1 Tax=Streptomyces sp. CNQ085 TaxID=2886944 RepID=UPI001F50D5CA|nr:hypothetical protein [Streptomyces sp. CNQ085]MCI0383991.1 hypothetical protein [Streptomyces sp. CNQ085]